MKIKNENLTNFKKFAEFCSKNFQIIFEYEQDGASEIVPYYKKGAKIKIKEKNKGSFTRYCKGKVTEECIRKGKNSPDPKIRKKATFADNARHWSKK